MRVGFGYDVHPMVSGRPLILGGVEIPYLQGLQGHSDADVLLHAVCDALLGAIGEGDIGRHFPDTDPQYKGIKSILLLKRVASLVREKGFHIVNIDSTIVAQRPKLSDAIPRMVQEIAGVLDMESRRVNVKEASWRRSKSNADGGCHSTFSYKDYCVRSDPFASTGEPQSFGGGGLHTDPPGFHVQNTRNLLGHPRDRVGESRPLSHDR